MTCYMGYSVNDRSDGMSKTVAFPFSDGWESRKVVVSKSDRIVSMRIEIELLLGMDKIVHILKILFLFTLEVLNISEHI